MRDSPGDSGVSWFYVTKEIDENDGPGLENARDIVCRKFELG